MTQLTHVVLTESVLKSPLSVTVASVLSLDLATNPTGQDLRGTSVFRAPSGIPSIAFLEGPEVPSSAELFIQSQLSSQELSSLSIFFGIVTTFGKRVRVQRG